MMMHRRGLAFPQLKWTRIATHRYVRKVGSQPHIGCQGHPGSMFIEGMVWSEFAHTNARPNKLILIGVRVIIVVICPSVETYLWWFDIWHLMNQSMLYSKVMYAYVCVVNESWREFAQKRYNQIQPEHGYGSKAMEPTGVHITSSAGSYGSSSLPWL